MSANELRHLDGGKENAEADGDVVDEAALKTNVLKVLLDPLHGVVCHRPNDWEQDDGGQQGGDEFKHSVFMVAMV